MRKEDLIAYARRDWQAIAAAKQRRTALLESEMKPSASPVNVDPIESGVEAKEGEKAAFFHVADRLARTTDRTEQERLKEELAQMTFEKPK